MITLLVLCCLFLVTLVAVYRSQLLAANGRLLSLSYELNEETAECVRGDMVSKLLYHELKEKKQEIIALKLALGKKPWVLARIGPRE